MIEIEKPAFNDEWRTMEFRRPDGLGQLSSTETVQSAAVICRERTTGSQPIVSMVSEVAPYNQTSVLYNLKGGTPGKSYFLEFQVITSNNQKLSETVLLKVT